MAEILKNKNDYTTVAYFKDTSAFIPSNETQSRIADELKKLRFKDHHIRIMFEHPGLSLTQIKLEIQEAKLKSSIEPGVTPGKELANVMREKFGVNFNQDIKTNTMKYVHDLRVYASYLDENRIQWTYFNVYARRDRNIKLGRIYADQPIPKRIN